MNRFVSLLLVALCLAAVSLAQPAQAQQGQWYRGLPYFLSSNTQSSQSGTTITATINNNATGHVDIGSLPTNGYPGYSTGGTYTGSVAVYYVWSGNNPTSAMTLSTTQSYEDTGAGNSNSSGNSLAGTAYGDFSSGSTGWNTGVVTAPTHTDYFDAGVTPPSMQQSVSLGGNISAYYNNSYPGAATLITADVTFGPPVTTYP